MLGAANSSPQQIAGDIAATRRDFLKALSAASVAALAGGAPRLLADESGAHPRATADRVILLWMAGGMAGPETFDPKHYEPFKEGLPVEKVMSTFPAIDTAIPGVQICKGLENIASVLDRGTLIRSHVVADLGNILHSRHQYHWHTGYVPPLTVAERADGTVTRVRWLSCPVVELIVDERVPV